MRRRPDDPGAPGNMAEAEHEERDDSDEARAIFGYAVQTGEQRRWLLRALRRGYDLITKGS